MWEVEKSLELVGEDPVEDCSRGGPGPCLDRLLEGHVVCFLAAQSASTVVAQVAELALEM